MVTEIPADMLLRKAATAIRGDLSLFAADRRRFLRAVADWLDDVAADLVADLWPDGHDVPRNALVVARAYMWEPGDGD